MNKERNHIKVFVSSTVYDFESQLDMVYSTLDGYGYDVMMSHKGTIPLDSKLSNLENCLKGVEDCDVFLGFVRPLTGTGILKPGEKSIQDANLAGKSLDLFWIGNLGHNSINEKAHPERADLTRSGVSLLSAKVTTLFDISKF